MLTDWRFVDETYPKHLEVPILKPHLSTVKKWREKRRIAHGADDQPAKAFRMGEQQAKERLIITFR